MIQAAIYKSYQALVQSVLELALKDMFSNRQIDTVSDYLSAIDLITNEILCGSYCDILGIDYPLFRKRMIARLNMNPKYTREEIFSAISKYKPVIKESGAA
jgi:hypothetical protein